MEKTEEKNGGQDSHGGLGEDSRCNVILRLSGLRETTGETAGWLGQEGECRGLRRRCASTDTDHSTRSAYSRQLSGKAAPRVSVSTPRRVPCLTDRSASPYRVQWP